MSSEKTRTRKENKLRCYWDPKAGTDNEGAMVFGRPEGVGTEADREFLNEFVYILIDQLIMRGYDVETLKFEISPDFDADVPSSIIGVPAKKKFVEIK